jgi:hypothetical protein
MRDLVDGILDAWRGQLPEMNTAQAQRTPLREALLTPGDRA